jgi:hypothetical protein
MLKTKLFAACAGLMLITAPLSAAQPKTYQVTGPILEVTDKTIVVQKGDERWEIARDQSTKTKGDLKVGQKVTVHYRMTATNIESKPESSKK